MNEINYVIRALDEDADDFFRLNEFCCNEEGLNDFLYGAASAYHADGSGRTFLAINAKNNEIIGYYTLRTNGLPFVDPKHGTNKIIPVIEITRFAINHHYQNKKLGRDILKDVIKNRVFDALSPLVAFKAIYLLSLKTAAGFYEKLGFQELPDDFQNDFLEFDIAKECKAMILSLY